MPSNEGSSYNNLTVRYNHMKIHRRCLLPIAIAATGFLALTAPQVKATPYASCVTNNNGTIQFYLNESGGNVTVTYEDGSTNANFNGITTGTNEPSGKYSFTLGTHTTYSISVFKIGTGITALAPNVIQDTNINTINGSSYPIPGLFVLGAPRGVAANINPTSPYFGRLYVSRSEASAPNTFLYAFNSDGSFVCSNSAGVAWNASYSLSPAGISVAADDSLIVADGSSVNAGIWKVPPDLHTNELLLGPVGDIVTNAQGVPVHGEIISPAIYTGFTNNGSGSLMWIDGDYPASDANCLLVATNVMTNSLPYETVPILGPQIGLNYAYLGNVYPGLARGPNGYYYASEYRNNFATADMYVLDSTGTNVLWTSLVGPAGPDYFVNSVEGSGVQGLAGGCAVSPDGNWLVGMSVDNHFTICQLTNGIPNVATLYTVNPTTLIQNGRAVCFDAADNIYMVSSGEYCVQEWSLGLTATTVTTGSSTATGATGFQVVLPSENVSVTASNSVISQANSYGNPTSTFFVLTRAGDTNGTLTVDYSLTGAAINGGTNSGIAYPASVTASPLSSVIFQPGVTSMVVTVTAVADSTPRPTTSVTLTVATGSTYTPTFPSTASINVLNTAPQELFLSVGAPTMYNAFSNDYASFSITRWGDTNAAAYTVNSFDIVGGTAVEGTDYTTPSSVTIHPGDLTDMAYIHPLINGQLPIHTNILTYTGNKTIVVSLVSATGYTAAPNTNTLTIVDSANPSATVLYYDPLTNSAPTNWNIAASDLNYPVTSPNYSVNFGYNLPSNPDDPNGPGVVAIPNPPNGHTNALQLQTYANSYSGVVDLYPTNVTLSGNFAVRFNMNVTTPYAFATSGSFEGPLFGINCSGVNTNWWYHYSPSGPTVSSSAQGNWNMDGVWFWLTDSGASGWDTYNLFSGTNGDYPSLAPLVEADASSFTTEFKSAIFTSPGAPGIPCNGSPDNLVSLTSWADVEIKQFNNVITLSIDKTPIIVYDNTTGYTNGIIMLGYENPVFGPDFGDGAVYYSDLRVVQLTPPAINTSTLGYNGSTYTFDFTSPDGTATTSSFVVVGSATLTGTFSPVTGVSITQSATGVYEVTVPVSGSIHFYKVEQEF